MGRQSAAQGAGDLSSSKIKRGRHSETGAVPSSTLMDGPIEPRQRDGPRRSQSYLPGPEHRPRQMTRLGPRWLLPRGGQSRTGCPPPPSLVDLTRA